MADAAFSEWLQAQGRLTVATDAAVTTAWGDRAIAIDAGSPFDGEVPAAIEALRHLQFKGVPLVEEEILVMQVLQINAIRGSVRTVTIAGDPDYDSGQDVFVLGGERGDQSGTTRLFVLRRL